MLVEAAVNGNRRELHLVQQFIEVLATVDFRGEDDDLVVLDLHQKVEQRLALHLLLHVHIVLLQAVERQLLLVVDLDDLLALLSEPLS